MEMDRPELTGKIYQEAVLRTLKNKFVSNAKKMERGKSVVLDTGKIYDTKSKPGPDDEKRIFRMTPVKAYNRFVLFVDKHGYRQTWSYWELWKMLKIVG